MITNIQQHYEDIIRPDLLRKFNYENVHQIPKIEKIILNMGVKEAVNDKKQLLIPILILELITGQKAVVTCARKSISNFKIRKGFPIGALVTLRGDNMYSFLTKLVLFVLPRIRDFVGIPITSIDSQGNISFGIRDLLVFPEIESEYDKLHKTYGVNITIVTTAKTKLETKTLLSSFQIPFKE